MANTWKATDGKGGVDLLHTVTSANAVNNGGTQATFTLGTTVDGNNKSAWIYVYASSAIALGQLVAVRTSGTATLGTVTLARLGYTLGLAQCAFAAGDYGWVATRGVGLSVATTGAGAVGVRLYTSGTAGYLSTTAASTQAQIQDIRLLTTASGTTVTVVTAVASTLVVTDTAFII
jgi:hypothetical protein